MRLNILIKSILKPPNIKTVRYLSQEHIPKALRSLKPKSTRSTVQFYVDSCRVRAVAGNGGDGCISFLSAWCKDQAGPDGGDGGHGGHVIFQATHSIKSLNHCKSVIVAKNGEKGYNKDCCGKNAEHVVVQVPLGTIVKDSTGRIVGDLSTEGVMFVAARGGAGGRGNKFFLTDTEQAPNVAELGARGECITYHLEVRSMAHIGLLGFPNAGKSSLLRAITRARPTVAPYPFTTLRPHVGIIPYDDYEQVALADLPGLIPGSHKNRGLGIQFLQHVARCRGLIYLLDGTNDPLDQYENLSYELSQYDSNLLGRPSCVVVNKIDLEEGRRGFEEVKRELAKKKGELGSGEGHIVGDFSCVDMGSDLNLKNIEEKNQILNKENAKVEQLNSYGSSENNLNLDSDFNVENRDLNRCEKIGDEKMGDEKKLVLGISAKTGFNLEALLRVIRGMYDSGNT